MNQFMSIKLICFAWLWIIETFFAPSRKYSKNIELRQQGKLWGSRKCWGWKMLFNIHKWFLSDFEWSFKPWTTTIPFHIYAEKHFDKYNIIKDSKQKKNSKRTREPNHPTSRKSMFSVLLLYFIFFCCLFWGWMNGRWMRERRQWQKMIWIEEHIFTYYSVCCEYKYSWMKLP